MKYLLTLIALLVASYSHAAPFLTSDPDPTGAADKCVWQEGANAPVETPTVVVAPAVTGKCKIDLAPFTPGTHNLQVSFKSTLWGVSSASTPFVLSKPSAGGTGPANLVIGP